jgi:phosphoadenosine phosphosulfate reductase
MIWTPPEAPFDARVADMMDGVRARLTAISAAHPGAVLATSLQAEDQLLTHLIAEAGLPIAPVMLDTGRLHAETLALADVTNARFGLTIERHYPDAEALVAYEARFGRDGFYDSVAAREACCAIRKVAPLERALAGRSAWITGQRRAQAQGRAALPFEESDSVGRAKFNPLADWSLEDVWAAVRAFDIPVSALSNRGYPSIGCEPCTRAIRVGEDLRAGRWWWEASDSKECGLHVRAAETTA